MDVNAELWREVSKKCIDLGIEKREKEEEEWKKY